MKKCARILYETSDSIPKGWVKTLLGPPGASPLHRGRQRSCMNRTVRGGVGVWLPPVSY